MIDCPFCEKILDPEKEFLLHVRDNHSSLMRLEVICKYRYCGRKFQRIYAHRKHFLSNHCMDVSVAANQSHNEQCNVEMEIETDRHNVEIDENSDLTDDELHEIDIPSSTVVLTSEPQILDDIVKFTDSVY